MSSGDPEPEPIRPPALLNLPAHWWGPPGREPAPLTIGNLIKNQTIQADLAAWLWMLIEAGASTLVCAGPGGAGKSTLLAALTAFLPPDRTPYVVRGAYDPLNLFADRTESETTLLVNEISAHLPMYVWGAAARRVFDARRAGAQVLATAHATTRDEIVRLLISAPLYATEADVQGWDLVLFLDAGWEDGRAVRRVREAVSFSADTRLTSFVAGAAEPDVARMQCLARRIRLPGATIAREIERRRTALDLAP